MARGDSCIRIIAELLSAGVRNPMHCLQAHMRMYNVALDIGSDALLKEVRRLGVAKGEAWPRPCPQVKTNNMFS